MMMNTRVTNGRLSKLVPPLLLMVLLSGLAAKVDAQSESDPEVVRLTNGEWPPFQSEHSPHYGMASHIVTRAFEEVGVKVKYDFFPWKRALVAAQTGGWDGTFVWAYDPSKVKDFEYSAAVLELQDHCFFMSKTQFNYQSLSDLKSWRIGITNGYFYGEAFENERRRGEIRIQVNLTDEDNFHKLMENHIDLLIVNRTVGRYLIRKLYPTLKDRFQMSERAMRVATFHVLFSKNHEKASRNVDYFNRGLKKLMATGEYQSLFEKGLNGGYDPIINAP